MSGGYDLELVALSIIVAIIASYTALQLAGHVSRKRGSGSLAWLAGGAVAMGTGIWSMHFVGMLAFHLPVPIAYDAGLTVLSMAIAVVVSFIALALVRHPVQRWPHLLAGAAAMGVGISAMHYTGMYAMRMSPPIQYDPLLFTASVIIAIVASMVALWIAYRLRDKQFGVAVLAKLGSAVIMGLAITGMHYTGMAAAQFLPGSICLAVDSTGGMQTPVLALVIGITTTTILGVTLWVAALDARYIGERQRGIDALLRFGSAMDATADAIYLIDRATLRFVHVNAAAAKMLGIDTGDMSRDPADVLGVSRAELQQTFDALITGSDRSELAPVAQSLPDGATRWLEVRRHAQNFDGRWTIVTLARDITEQKAAADWIAHLNRVHAMLSAINSLIVRVRDRDELFRDACRIAMEQGGFPLSWIGMVDRDANRIVPAASAGASAGFIDALTHRFVDTSGPPLGPSRIAAALRDRKVTVLKDLHTDPAYKLRAQFVAAGVQSSAVLPLLVRDEAVGVFNLYSAEPDFFKDEELKLLTDLAGNIAFAIDHIANQERLDYLAYYDELTGLANRTLFLERVAQSIRSASAAGKSRLALFVLDLERFRDINDSLGRPAGDALLRQAASWLTAMTGDGSLIGRVGSNHFAVLLPRIREDGDLNQLLDKHTALFVAHRFEVQGSTYHLAVKVGASLYPNHGPSADQLFRNAEAALNKAKLRGERYVFYSPAMTDVAVNKLTLENRLRQAMNRNEFVLHYQPKIDLGTGRMTGAEGLLRWNDPHSGLRPPADFIGILEETGLIHDVGRWSLRQAIRDHRYWRATGMPPVPVAINVSPRQLRHRDFVAEIERMILDVDGAAEHIELEITESVIMDDIERSIAILHAIRALGVKVAIDDFGTGFSSLSYLSRLPVDALKIDRSFINAITVGAEGLALVSTIINLAHTLKLNVVAEGVETEEQWTLLQSLGCNEMQGYLYSRPVASDVFQSRFLGAPLANAPRVLDLPGADRAPRRAHLAPKPH